MVILVLIEKVKGQWQVQGQRLTPSTIPPLQQISAEHLDELNHLHFLKQEQLAEPILALASLVLVHRE
jgi:hypothetical protein